MNVKFKNISALIIDRIDFVVMLLPPRATFYTQNVNDNRFTFLALFILLICAAHKYKFGVQQAIKINRMAFPRLAFMTRFFVNFSKCDMFAEKLAIRMDVRRQQAKFIRISE